MSITKKIFVSAFIGALALVVSTANAAYMHTVTLKVGSTGSQVMSLQQTLNMTSCKVSTVGAGAPGFETTTFGLKTKAAVQCFQASQGLTADGVVGPMTGAKLYVVSNGSVSGNFPAGCTSAAGYSTVNGQRCDATPAGLPAGCTTTAGYSPQTGQACSGGSSTPAGGLNGTVGSLDYSLVSSLSNEEVGEDASDVKVAGLELDADNSDSDVRITSVKLVFAQGTATNDDFDEFADDVTVWLGSTKVGSADASEFNDDNDYTKTITLNNAVVDMDDSEDLVVAVSGVSNVDSGDEGDTWTVDFRQIRFVDAQGATTTEDPTESPVTFSFLSFASANDVELKASLNSDEDDINDAHNLVVDDNDETDNVAILAFTLEAAGDSDINVSEIPVKLTTNDLISDVVQSVDLYHGTTKIGSEDASAAATTETITFDDLDIDIDAGDEEEFTVKVTLYNTDDYTDGSTTLKAELTSTQVDAIDAEDETGEEVSTTDLTGTALGGTHTLSTTEATIDVTNVTEVGTSTDADDAYEQGTFTFYVTISAENGAVDVDAASIDETLIDPAANTVGLTMQIANLDGDATENTAGTDYTVEDGEENTFAIIYTIDPDAAGQYFVRLNSIDGITVDEQSEGLSLVAS